MDAMGIKSALLALLLLTGCQGLFVGLGRLDGTTSGHIEGTRIQKFMYMGMGANPGGDMGAAWPTDRRRSD